MSASAAWLDLLLWFTPDELRSLLDEGAAAQLAARVPGLRCPSEERAAEVVADVLAEMYGEPEEMIE